MNGTEKKVKLFVGGMTCVNCQNRIEKKLKNTKGIVSAGVSYNKGTADIVYDEKKISPDDITAVIEKIGYKVLTDGSRQGTGIIRLVCTLAVIIALYLVLQRTGVLNLLVPSRLADTGMGYGMLFVIGLATSVHCIAMCGGINLSQCIPQTRQKETAGNRLEVFVPSLMYNLGRVLSYTVVGFILGLAGFLIGGGSEVGISFFLQGVLKMAAGVFMIIMGINMLGLFPWLRRFTIRVPKFLACSTGKKKAAGKRPFIVGILNGFMPCGPLQSMWIAALASGDPFSGALSMFLFSLGTVPLMLGLGSVVSALGRKFTDKVMTVGAVLVVVLGLAMLSQGGVLSGWISSGLMLILLITLCAVGVLLSIPVKKKIQKNLLRAASLAVAAGACFLWIDPAGLIKFNSGSGNETEVVGGIQIANSTLESGSYPDITVQAGIPVRWIIDAPEGSINGCNYKIMIQEYDMEYTFHTGENIIEFTPEKTGNVEYSCWMGMIRGNIFVV
ncbi:MAG: sulfite exporter TauE/SafE family protein [Porcipelethomonas sp.]